MHSIVTINDNSFPKNNEMLYNFKILQVSSFIYYFLIQSNFCADRPLDNIDNYIKTAKKQHLKDLKRGIRLASGTGVTFFISQMYSNFLPSNKNNVLSLKETLLLSTITPFTTLTIQSFSAITSHIILKKLIKKNQNSMKEDNKSPKENISNTIEKEQSKILYSIYYDFIGPLTFFSIFMIHIGLPIILSFTNFFLMINFNKIPPCENFFLIFNFKDRLISTEISSILLGLSWGHLSALSNFKYSLNHKKF